MGCRAGTRGAECRVAKVDPVRRGPPREGRGHPGETRRPSREAAGNSEDRHVPEPEKTRTGRRVGIPTSVFERQMGNMLLRIQESPFKGAWRATAIITVSVTIASGLLMRLTDPDEFTSVWDGLWWSAQTV